MLAAYGGTILSLFIELSNIPRENQRSASVLAQGFQCRRQIGDRPRTVLTYAPTDVCAKLLDGKDAINRERVKRFAACCREKLEKPAGFVATARESVEAARTHMIYATGKLQ
jgi:hypothetical protein